MIAHHFEHHDFYVDQGLHYLQKLDDLIKDGRVAERLIPWAADAKQKFETLKSDVKKALEEQESSAAAAEEEEEAEVEEEEQDDEEDEDVYQTSVAGAEKDDIEFTSSQQEAQSEVISNIPHLASLPSKFPLRSIPEYPSLKWPLTRLAYNVAGKTPASYSRDLN